MSLRWMPQSRRDGRARGTVGKAGSRSKPHRRRALAAMEWLEDRTLLSTSIPLNSETWTAMGPAGIGGTSGFGGGNGGPSAGRISGVAADPNDPNTIYVAATGGGVWKTTDAGKTWKPLTDDQPTLMMGSIAVSKSNPQVIYAGTGQADNAGDSYYGRGVLKSTDGGNTWALTGNPVFDLKAVMKVVIDPNNPSTVYAAVATPDVNGNPGGNGVWKTTDGGNTWTNTTTTISVNDDFTDLVVDPSNPQTLYAAVGTGFGSAVNGVYKTTNGGASWSLAGNFPVGTGNGRISLAISASNPQELLASVSNPPTDGLKYLLKTTDAGATWSPLSSAPSYLGGQGSYDNTVAISPTDPNLMFAGGVTNYNFSAPFNMVIESTDGGTTWTDASVDPSGGEPHTDLHASTFDAAGRLLIAGDGGIWRLDNATPGGLLWTDINGNLNTVQFVGAALDPTNADIIYGGSQDNGTEKFTDNLTWNQFWGGDGGYVAVNPANPQQVFLENFGVSLRRSDDGGKTTTLVTTGISNTDPANFYVPYTLDPSDPTHLLYGTDKLYTTSNSGNSWTVLATPGTNGFNVDPNFPINSIAIAPSDPKTIYVATDDARIFVSTDGGTNWTENDIAADQDSVSQVVVDPTDPQTAYAVRAAFDGDGGGTGHVFKTTDGGANWLDISGNLPNVPANAFAIDPRAGNQRLYVGTDDGVYASSDNGATWARFKAGLPDAHISTLELSTGLDILMAATYGRGVWEIKATESVSVLPNPLTATEGLALNDVQVARFNDSTGLLPVGSYTATINWGDGTPPSAGTIVDVGGGFYGVNGTHTYADEGNFKTTVTVSGSDGNTGLASGTATVDDAPLSPVSAGIAPTEGAKFSGVVGSFTDANPGAPVSDFTASINWGNGNVTVGTVTPVGGGVFTVSGSNSYRAPGQYPVNITVNDVGGAGTVINSLATVQDAPLSSTPATLSAIAGTAFSAVVASFTDADPNATVAYYGVTVNWGDGTTSTLPAVTIANRGSRFDVTAGHTYHKFGTYQVAVKITDFGGATTTALSTAVVADAPIGANPSNFTATEGTSFTGQVGSFTSSNPFASAADFQGTTINWGDGTAPSVATITAQGGGKFAISGTHTYAEEGAFVVTAKVTSAGGSTATATGTAAVLDASVSANGVALSGTAGQTVAGTVATFVDAYALAPLSDFTATIDWGDGTTSPGAVSQPGGTGTPFVVTGSHAWSKPQTFDVQVTVNDVGGATDTSSAPAVMGDAPVTAAGVTIPPVFAGNGYSGSVGTFTSGNPLASATDFLAQIDWGDGSQSGGQITALGGGSFGVSSLTPHVYTQVGDYSVTLTAISLGGNRASATSALTVKDAPIAGTPGPDIQSVAGQTFNGLVGTFTANPFAAASTYTATIAWGDGQTTRGTVTAGTNGSFTVTGSEAFRAAGEFPVNVTVVSQGGSTGTFTVGATVADAAISGHADPVSAVQGAVFAGPVATFTDANPYAGPTEFKAVVDWGDGTAPSAGAVTESGGTFTVTGTHVYANPAASLPVTVTVVHTVTGVVPASLTSTSFAHVLTPLAGAMYRASDTGVSNVDGVTGNNHPIFLGRAEPGSTVPIYAVPLGNPSGTRLVGTGYTNAAGNWAVQISPLADGSYQFVAAMIDPQSNTQLQAKVLPVTPAGTLLTVATSGPTVAAVSLDPRSATLHVTFQGGPGYFNPAGVFNAANYGLALPVGLGLQPIAPTGLTASAGPNGQITVNVAFGRTLGAGGYVVTLNSAAITDLAGNILNEQHFVTFPQANNSPNPNYVAQIDVSRTGAASAPHLYVSLAEQIAANNFSNLTQGQKVVRVPQTAANRISTRSILQPSSFRRGR